MVKSLFGKSKDQLVTVATELGARPFRGRQLYDALYRRFAGDWEEMTDLSKGLRDQLSQEYVIGRSPHETVSVSADGTKKYLFACAHGYVEAAVIPEGKRTTLCLSTQVGCKRGCTFCQTGRQGFHGNLTPGDILNQYASLPERDAVTSIVYMGMGEPLDNIQATLESLNLFSDPDGVAFSPKRITLSTVGIHPELQQFLDSSVVNLAISMHSPFPEERRRIMPVERQNRIVETIDIIRRTREDRRRKVTFEYTLFRGVNDTEHHARELARLLGDLSVRVNLIPYHPIPNAPYQPTPAEDRETFRRMLTQRGLRSFIRTSRGQDIQAACGLLSTRHTREQDGD